MSKSLLANIILYAKYQQRILSKYSYFSEFSLKWHYTRKSRGFFDDKQHSKQFYFISPDERNNCLFLWKNSVRRGKRLKKGNYLPICKIKVFALVVQRPIILACRARDSDSNSGRGVFQFLSYLPHLKSRINFLLGFQE